MNFDENLLIVIQVWLGIRLDYKNENSPKSWKADIFVLLQHILTVRNDKKTTKKSEAKDSKAVFQSKYDVQVKFKTFTIIIFFYYYKTIKNKLGFQRKKSPDGFNVQISSKIYWLMT